MILESISHPSIWTQNLCFKKEKSAKTWRSFEAHLHFCKIYYRLLNLSWSDGWSSFREKEVKRILLIEAHYFLLLGEATCCCWSDALFNNCIYFIFTYLLTCLLWNIEFTLGQFNLQIFILYKMNAWNWTNKLKALQHYFQICRAKATTFSLDTVGNNLILWRTFVILWQFLVLPSISVDWTWYKELCARLLLDPVPVLLLNADQPQH